MGETLMQRRRVEEELSLIHIFAIGAPGVPGGTVMASLGLITGVLMFDNAGTALMLAIFALQDRDVYKRQGRWVLR